MRYLMLCVLSLIVVKAYHAQESNQNWPIVEQCLGEPVEAPEAWSFDGFIAYYNNDGIHAIRANLETPYFLAFSTPGQFIQFASFSPDGRWLKVPAGRQGWRNWVEDWYWIEEFRIYSTGLDRELVHRIPWEFVFSASKQPYYNPMGDWAGNDYFISAWGSDYNLEYVRYELDNQIYESIPVTPLIEQTEEAVENTNQLVFIGDNYGGDAGISEVYEIENGRLVFKPSAFYHDYNTNINLELRYSDGTRETIIDSNEIRIFSDYFVSPNGRYLGFAASENLDTSLSEGSIYLLDMDTQRIINTCIPRYDESYLTGYAMPLAWSPDSSMFSLSSSKTDTETSENRLILFDLEAYQLYYGQYFQGQVMGWYQGD